MDKNLHRKPASKMGFFLVISNLSRQTIIAGIRGGKEMCMLVSRWYTNIAGLAFLCRYSPVYSIAGDYMKKCSNLSSIVLHIKPYKVVPEKS